MISTVTSPTYQFANWTILFSCLLLKELFFPALIFECAWQICKRCNDLRDTDDEISKLFVLQGESRAAHEAKLFVDVAVYTRNRAFRLPYSSKAGKTSLLLPTSRFGSSNLVSSHSL
jgi:hypothetical protein